MRTLKWLIFCSFFCSPAFGQQFRANYDESKVTSYQLPDPLLTLTKQRISDADSWEKIRRPEVLRLFEDNVYGQMPRVFDSIRYQVVREDHNSMDGRARRKEVIIRVFRNNSSVSINLLLFIPNAPRAAVPVLLLINNRGKENTDPTRKIRSEFWPAETVIDNGYAIAAFHVDDLAPDDSARFMDGVLKLYPDQLAAQNGMRAIGAWAWGASRVMDYFEGDPDIAKEKVFVVGHSRGGKASLWAAAQDQRFAGCLSNCSGNSGAALSRRKFGERIRFINTTFPHWFTPNYKKYNDREEDLPVDQHMLISLIAPRPVYVTSATDDLWADPRGTYLALLAAAPVYDLYGGRKLPQKFPAVNEPLTVPQMGYHIREGKHDLTLFDWNGFIRFIEHHKADR